MAASKNRLQLLLDDERRERLERESERTGAPIAELVRRAIDRAYPSDPSARRDALEMLLGLDPMPVGDWAEMKREMRDKPGHRAPRRRWPTGSGTRVLSTSPTTSVQERTK